MTEFSGATALVTGGGSGIGRALAQALAREGARVAVTDVDLAAARATAEAIKSAGGEAEAYALDVTNDEQWTTVVEAAERALGPIDVLCSNAGSSSSRTSLTEMSVDYMRWLFDVNVLGTVRAIRSVVPGMKARNRGHVLITGSMASLWTGSGGADYSATKHALLAVADVLRHEVEGSAIHVGLLCPAAVPTKLAQTTSNRALSGAGLTVDPRDPLAHPNIAELTRETGGLVEPDAVAQISLDGLRAKRFFIITHPASGRRALERNAELADELASAARRQAAANMHAEERTS